MIEASVFFVMNVPFVRATEAVKKIKLEWMAM